VTEFVTREINFERCLVFLHSEEAEKLRVQAWEGYHDQEVEQTVAALSLSGQEEGLLPLVMGADQVLCPLDDDQEELRSLGNAFGMDEYIVFPMVGEYLQLIGLLVIGNSAGGASYNRIEAESVIVIGLANLASLAATTVNYVNFYQALEQERELLEERVKQRTRGLETVSNLSERLVAILNLEQLLLELVNRVEENFGYYHAHIYLLDEARQELIMTAGAGEPGRKMKAQGHHIPLQAKTSLVARAARNNEIVWVDNVREAPDWLPNPLLPDTYSEMSVPIMLEGEVVGVLDVQSNRIAGLDEGDANLLRSLANQAAVAMRNARLFEQVETAMTEAQTVQERYTVQAWEKVRAVRRGAEYRYQRLGAPFLEEEIIARLEQEAMKQNQPTIVTQAEDNAEDQNRSALIAPIKLQNRTIGTIQFQETDPARPHQWDDTELALVQTVADQVAQVAENLRLFEEARNRAVREQTIREITDKLRATASLEELVRTAAEALSDRLLVGHAVVELGIEKNADEPDVYEPTGVETNV
jgi:GAF domain-containing protein